MQLMRISELFESLYHTNVENTIRRDILECQTTLKLFDTIVNVNGWKYAEDNPKALLNQQRTSDDYFKWMLTTPKLKASYAKLQSVRKQLEDKINSGV